MDAHDFGEISAKMNGNLLEDEKKVREYCLKSSIIPLSDFNGSLVKELLQINSQITPSKERPTIDDFKSAFKEFDDYPPNLQKPKKSMIRETSRLNNMTMKTDSGMMDSTVLKEPFDFDKCEKLTAGEIYSEFKRFQTKLSSLKTELKQQHTLAEEHFSKLQQLNTFNQQLEKLLSANNLGEEAFTAAEEKTIQRIASNLEDLKGICDHQNIYHQDGSDDLLPRLRSVTDILEYTLRNLSFN